MLLGNVPQSKMKELNKQLSSNILSQVVGESRVLGKCEVGRGHP